MAQLEMQVFLNGNEDEGKNGKSDLQVTIAVQTLCKTEKRKLEPAMIPVLGLDATIPSEARFAS